MLHTLRRLGVVGLLAGALSALPAVSARQPEPDVPPFDRAVKPGEPPVVPGADEDRPRGDEPEILGRGPVHEGFAQPGEAPQAGPVAPKGPPEPIPEQPPDERPEGDNVAWIPGYWGWDEDRRDFLWVSGFWRVVPNGRKWVPGYWSRIDSGWQWVSGFWARADQSTIPYVPEAPPESLDRGPTLPAPDDSYFYVPGNWLFQETRHVWQPGYWCRPRPRQVWCPPRWCWTPRGHLFVSGFWDACLEDRGVLFAPVYFPRPLWNRPGWAFCPAYAIPPRALVGSLWVRPRFGQYAFGDFYGAKYAKLGYQPWAVHGPRSRDPLFGAYRAADRNWQRDIQATHTARVRGDAPLPPRTLNAQQALAGRGQRLASNLEMVRPLERFQSEKLRLTKTPASERTARDRYLESLRQAGAERRTQETRGLQWGGQPGGLPLNRVPGPAEATKPRTQPREAPPRTDPLPRVTPSPREGSGAPRPTPRVDDPPRKLLRDTAPSPKLTRPADPPPKLNPTPRDRPQAAPPAPRPAPKLTPPADRAPKLTPAPKDPPRIETPRPAPKLTRPADPAPKLNPPPRPAPPAPRLNPAPKAPPRIETPPPRPAPKLQPAPAPRVNPAPRMAPAPTQAPRVNPAPRIAPTPAPRVNPPPAARPGPGGPPRGNPRGK